MKSITINAYVNGDAIVSNNTDGTILSMTVPLTITLINDDKEILIDATATAWGAAAGGFYNVEDSYVVVTGNLEINEDKLHIANASFIQCSPRATINRLCLAGNVGTDPELRHFESGAKVCKYTLAARRDAKATDWFKVEIWGKQAETADNHVTKGAKSAVSGSLRVEQWADRGTGQLKTRFGIRVESLTLLGPVAQSGNGGGGGRAASSSRQQRQEVEEYDF